MFFLEKGFSLFFSGMPEFSLFKRLNRHRMFHAVKGYRELRAKNQLHTLKHLEEVLTNERLAPVRSSGLRGEYFIDWELSFRQFLVSRVLGLRFNKSILYSIGSGTLVRHPLPKPWRRVLESEGFKVDHFTSKLLWISVCYLYLLKGFFRSVKGVGFLTSQKCAIEKYVYFDNLVNGKSGRCFSNDISRKNIVNWYLGWKGRSPVIDYIGHNAEQDSSLEVYGTRIKNMDPIPPLAKWEGVKYATYLFFNLMLNLIIVPIRPHRAMLFEEISKARRVELSCPTSLARDYLFNNSTAIYRPLWTYVAADLGSRILFYFYSTNNEPFKGEEGYPKYNIYHLMSWPHYLVWDEYQVNFLKRLDIGNPVIEDVGVIWFSSSDMEFDVLPNSIAVFDVAPVKPSLFSMQGSKIEYRTYYNANKFLSDVLESASKSGFSMAHKTKRTYEGTHRRYAAKLKQLVDCSNYQYIHPSVDAFSVIQNTKATISSPFTSTAIVAKVEGKPSAYYDPTGIIKKDDRAAHGIEVLNSIDELYSWILQIDCAAQPCTKAKTLLD